MHIFLNTLFIIITACTNSPEELDNWSKNSRKIISSDLVKLNKVINVKRYNPSSVKYSFEVLNDLKLNDRLDFIGPIDYKFEAVLYFDSINFLNILSKCNKHCAPEEYCVKDEFKFNWLDTVLLNELENSGISLQKHGSCLFNGIYDQKIWVGNRKIFIKGSTR